MTLTSLRTRALVAVVTAATLLGASAVPAAADADPVVGDAALATCIRATLGLGEDAPLGRTDLSGLVTLACDQGVTSLDGLENATALVSLDIRDQDVSDLSPLAQLPVLARLNVAGNAIADASLLSEFPALAEVDLSGQTIDFVSAECALVTLPTLRGASGAKVQATPITSAAYQFGDQWMPWDVYSAFEFDDGAGFNGIVHSYVSDRKLTCPWPSTAAKPSVKVSGTALTGQTLRASVSPGFMPGGAESAVSVSWKDASTGVHLGSGATFAPTTRDLGRTIVAQVDVWVDHMETRTARSGPTSAVIGGWPSSVSVSYLNTPVTGTNPAVTVRGLPATAPNPSFKYTWKIDGATVATTDWGKNTTYVIPSSARGKSLSVAVSVRGTGYETKSYAGPSAIILGTLGEVQRTYPVAGTVAAGRTVSIQAPTYGVSPSSRTYQWRRDGKAISGATASAYKLTSADAGHKVSVAVISKRSGYASSTWVSESRTVPHLFSTAPTPTISGTPTVGYTLTASAGAWKPTPSSVSYRWYRDGKAITGATARTYKATSTDIGHKITVKTTAKRSGYSTTTRASASKTIGRKLAAVTPTVTGTAKVGNSLTVKRGTWGPGTVATKVQWYVSGKAVSGATGSTFRVRPTDAYRSITVKVTGSKSGYTTASRTSAAKKPVGIDYASCADMRKHYPDGVAKASTVIDMISGKRGGPITKATFVSASLYALNDESDRDKDGWACEP